MQNNPHDAFFKRIFSVPEHAAGELRSVLPPEVAASIAWETLALVPGSFVDEDLARSHTDLLFSAHVAGREVLLYFLFEHLSTVDPLVPFRLLCYEVRIWQAHLARHPQAKSLPPIVPLVLHHSDTGWRAATTFEEVLDIAPELRGALAPFVPRFGFLLDDVSHATDQGLRRRAMTALGKLALLCLRDARRTDFLLERLVPWADLVVQVLAAPNGLTALSATLKYIKAVTRRPLKHQEVLKAVSQLIDTTKEADSGRDLSDVLADIFMDDACRKVLLRQLKKRFGPLPESVVERVNAAGAATLETWLDRVLTEATLDDILAGA